jgi:hypothetical protein
MTFTRACSTTLRIVLGLRAEKKRIHALRSALSAGEVACLKGARMKSTRLPWTSAIIPTVPAWMRDLRRALRPSTEVKAAFFVLRLPFFL